MTDSNEVILGGEEEALEDVTATLPVLEEDDADGGEGDVYGGGDGEGDDEGEQTGADRYYESKAVEQEEENERTSASLAESRYKALTGGDMNSAEKEALVPGSPTNLQKTAQQAIYRYSMPIGLKIGNAVAALVALSKGRL